jgi:hypothetical protein
MARMARGTRGTPNKKGHPFNFSLFFFFEINGDLCIFVARNNFQNIINLINILLMTTKKMYEKPSMKVVPLRQKPALLVGSPVTQSASIEDYEDGTFSW